MKQLTSDTTTVTIDTATFPKNKLWISQSGTVFTIRTVGGVLITDKTPYNEFTDASGVPYTTPALFLTAFKAAAYTV